jgi:hypothetical protein
MGIRRRPQWGAIVVALLMGMLGAGLTDFTQAGLAEVSPQPDPVASPASAPAGGAVPAEPAQPADPVGAPAATIAPDPVAPAPEPCAAALDWVAGAGLTLPAGVGYHCPSTEYAHQGAACWTTVCSDAYIAINMERLVGATPEYLRHVVAHEVCHILDWQTTGRTSEAGADACASAHGASA